MPRPLKLQGNEQIRMMMRFPPTPGSACRPEAERTAKHQVKQVLGTSVATMEHKHKNGETQPYNDPSTQVDKDV